MHRDGYGFVIPNAGQRSTIEGDIYISPQAVGSAMHGDQVLVELGRRKDDGRSEGKILRVLTRAHPTVVGTFHHGTRHNYVTPIDDKVTKEIVIPKGMERLKSHPFPRDEKGWDTSGGHSRPRAGQRGASPRMGRSRGARGGCRDHELAFSGGEPHRARGGDTWLRKTISAWMSRSSFASTICRTNFRWRCCRRRSSLSGRCPRRSWPIGSDYRALPIVTIDGETARDFDDAVTVKRLANGNFELQVHIADVAHYVREGSPIDLEARLRGTSVYFPDRAIPMLPMELSTDLCSLRPQVDRLVLSCVMEIDPHGEIVGYTLNEGMIRSAERMTYTNVNLILEGDAGLRQHYHKYVDVFELMRDLAMILNRKRVRRGSIDFDLPEPVIEFDENGLMKGVTRSERNIAHRLIEEFMLAANECVASYLEKKHIASLYRIHEKPDPKRVYDFETIAATFGYSLGVGALPVKRVQIQGRTARAASRRTAGEDARVAAGSTHHAAHVSEADAEDCGQAGRAHSLVPDAAFAEAGALLGGKRGALRAGGPDVHAFHFADPSLSGLDRAPHFEGRAAGFARARRRRRVSWSGGGCA